MQQLVCFILCTAQFDGVERMSKEESSSPTVKQQTLRHKSWTPKSLRPNPPSPTSPSSPSIIPDSETPIVDPTLPLEKQRCVCLCLKNMFYTLLLMCECGYFEQIT